MLTHFCTFGQNTTPVLSLTRTLVDRAGKGFLEFRVQEAALPSASALAKDEVLVAIRKEALPALASLTSTLLLRYCATVVPSPATPTVMVHVPLRPAPHSPAPPTVMVLPPAPLPSMRLP